MRKQKQFGLLTAIAILAVAGLNGCNDESASTANEDLCATKTCSGELTCAVIDDAAVCVCGADNKVCASTQECKNGVCEEKPQEDLCKDVSCTGESVCDAKTGKCLCGKVECDDDEVCTGGSCEKTNTPDPCETLSCGSDKTCSDGKCYCGESVCSAEMVCDDGECKNPLNLCENIQCSGDSVCVDGKCLCGETECGTTEICTDGECVKNTNACNPVCTGDAVCTDGECLCGDTVCDEGLTCSNGNCLCGTTECDLATHTCIDGVCEEMVITPCTGKVCNYGETCIVVGDEGKCVDELCQVDGVEKTCDPGNKCVAGDCIDERCVDFVCGDGMKCGVVENEAKCLCGEIECPEGTSCVEGACVDPCETVHCAETDLCAGGECSCDGKGTVCDTLKGEQCINHVCQTVDTCNNACAEGLTCINGECLCAGSGRACLDSETCYYDVCVDSLCIDKVCTGENQLCEKGKCIPAACKGVECEAGYGCNKTGHCVFEKCVDVECSAGKTCREDGTCHFEEQPKLIVNSDGSKTREDDESNGKFKQILVSLDKAPTSNVTVAVSVSNKYEAKILDDGDILKFTPSDYNKAQIVKVAGIRDYVIDGPVVYDVELKASSKDTDFNGLAESLEMTNVDVDEASLVITNNGGTTTTEDGGKVTLKVKLSAKPTSDVTIAVTSSDPEEGVVSVSSLKFTKNDWSNEQIITVTGQDDAESDGEQTYYLEFGDAVSSDKNFSGMKTESIKLVNADNDKAGIKASGKLEQNEGTSANIGISLMTKPQGNVTVKAALVDSDKSDEVQIVTTGGVTFSPSDYQTTKNIQLNYLTDNIKDGNQSWRIKLTASSSESDYNGLTSELNGVTKDIDTAELVFGKCAETTLKEGDSTICDIKLSSQPQNTVTLNAVATNNKIGATVTPATTTFAAKGKDWNTFKTFTITGIKDNIVDGNQVSNITFSTKSDGKYFNDLSSTKVITVQDINSASVILPSSYTTSLAERYSSTNYNITVKLGGKPSSDVTITAISSDTTELEVNESSLVLSPDKWDTGVTFSYHAVDDSELDGTQNASITFKLSSSDLTFNKVSGVTDLMSIVDNESAGISVTESISTISCASIASTNVMGVKLASAPTSDVTLSLSLVDKSGNKINNVTKGISISPETLKFSPSNWTANQVVTIKGPIKGSLPAQSYYDNVYLQAKTSGGGLYDGKTLKTVNSLFSLMAFCSPGTITSTTSLTLPKGQYRMTVYGAGGGSYTTSAPSARYGGRGGKTTAVFRLFPEKTTAYINIGGGGSTCLYNKSCGGANGGGNGTYSVTTQYGCGGGGGTDIRLGSNTFAKRVIVAGGGGGAMYGVLAGVSDGSQGGGANGQDGQNQGIATITTPGGGQNGCRNGLGKNSICFFGSGNPDPSSNLAGGGGGGWYTGATGQAYKHSGAGGSSFIYGVTATGTTYTNAGGTLSSKDVEYVTAGLTYQGAGAANDTNGSAEIIAVIGE